MSGPNILFVFADQLRYDALGSSGNRMVRTPHLDRLAGEGVAFDQAFSACPICSPYRAQVLTGNYSHVNGVVCNEYRLFDDQRTLAHRLGEHGYRSAFLGKWHLGYGPYPEHCRYGFDELLAYNCCHRYYHVAYWRNESGPHRMVEYAPRCETRLTLEWIAEHRREHPRRPFLAMLGWGPPHWTGSGAAAGSYGAYPQEYKLYDPARVDVPDNVPGQFRDFAARELADYYGMVTSLDDQMGVLLDGLERMGLADDTIVCFSSDHGDHLSAHGYGKPGDGWMDPTLRMSKATPHEESIHVPFIMRGPGVAGGRRSDVLLNSVDVLPTLMALANLPCPQDVQGRDLSHGARDEAGDDPDSVYLQILGPGWPNRIRTVGLWRGLRTHEFTYARWRDRGGRRVLYDRRADPLEVRNVVDDPDYA
ncbi:MAG: sulfatase family protein, partial [Planctomycetota bacterium]